MQRQFVSSSNLASVGYDPAASVLEVEFLNGSVYQYWGVPAWIYEGLMAAASKGRYLCRRVRSVYSYQRVY
ncbi:MAG: KTSC domain-containing protein [Coleofasciculaceae cyanobacterium SM2_1_6]|nr:KTSC domain-containing protein [Coleofasciculaceae cyanobacterium SM2_1_6]